MSRLALVQCGQFIHTAEGVERLVGNVDRIVRGLGIPAWHHCDPLGFVPIEHCYAFVERAASLAGTDTLFATIMEQSSPAHIGGAFAPLLQAPTVYQALQSAVRAVQVHGTLKQWWIVEKEEEILLCQRLQDGRVERGQAEMNRYTLVGIVQIIRFGAGPRWRPDKIWTDPITAVGLEKVDTFAQSQIIMDPTTSAVAVPRSILCLPLRYIPALTASEQTGLFSDPAAVAPKGDDVAGAIREIVRTLLVHGPPSIDVVAEVAGLHVRSLQRVLERRGTTYQKLVAESRFRAAARLLANSDARITDICYDMGYSDPAHFTRAFRRWAGLSPRAYRRHRLNDGKPIASSVGGEDAVRAGPISGTPPSHSRPHGTG